MNNYQFTQNWFTTANLKNILNFDNQEELHFLEVGSFEGRSTIWFLENYLLNKKSTITCIDPWLDYSQDTNSFNSYGTEKAEWKLEGLVDNNFIHNIRESGKEKQVVSIKGFSHEVLPHLFYHKKKYDFIFIDGNHTAPFVLADAVMAWFLLKQGGIMLFDDYMWGLEEKPTLRPGVAIDNFISNFSDYLTVIYKSERIAIIKK